MLIRSQDKRMIVNFDNICTVSAFPERDSEDWNCDECHRKYNGWGISMSESNKIAKEILNRLGE